MCEIITYWGHKTTVNCCEWKIYYLSVLHEPRGKDSVTRWEATLQSSWVLSENWLSKKWENEIIGTDPCKINELKLLIPWRKLAFLHHSWMCTPSCKNWRTKSVNRIYGKWNQFVISRFQWAWDEKRSGRIPLTRTMIHFYYITVHGRLKNRFLTMDYIH